MSFLLAEMANPDLLPVLLGYDMAGVPCLLHQVRASKIPVIVFWILKEMFIFAVTRENVLHS